jgi:hypothetical protein
LKFLSEDDPQVAFLRDNAAPGTETHRAVACDECEVAMLIGWPLVGTEQK